MPNLFFNKLILILIFVETILLSKYGTFQVFEEAELLPFPEAIINGVKVETYVPFMVGIDRLCTENSRKWCNNCGGAIISDRWVLTAAHCFGFHLNKTVYIDKIIRHERFDSKTGINDIALLKTTQPFKLGEAQARRIEINRYENLTTNTVVKIYGYGYGSFNNLTMIDAGVEDHHYCQQQWNRSELKVSDKQFCVGVDDSDSSRGDSGGPAVLYTQGRTFLAGIVSFGTYQEDPITVPANSKPGVYTDVRCYFDWILNTIKQNKNKNEKELFLHDLEAPSSDNKTQPRDNTLYQKPISVKKNEYFEKRKLPKIFLFIGYFLLMVIAVVVLHYTTVFIVKQYAKI